MTQMSESAEPIAPLVGGRRADRRHLVLAAGAGPLAAVAGELARGRRGGFPSAARGKRQMGVSMFFSHSTRDRRWCELLATEALKVGVTPYLAEHDPQSGTLLAEKVKGNVADCQALVVLLTHNTANSAYSTRRSGGRSPPGRS
jgi:hypothetical protein